MPPKFQFQQNTKKIGTVKANLTSVMDKLSLVIGPAKLKTCQTTTTYIEGDQKMMV